MRIVTLICLCMQRMILNKLLMKEWRFPIKKCLRIGTENGAKIAEGGTDDFVY